VSIVRHPDHFFSWKKINGMDLVYGTADEDEGLEMMVF